MGAEIEEVGGTFTTSDWIAIANLFVTSLIGIWLALIVQKNFTINRAIKDYYIQEIKDVRKLYVDFLNNVYKGNCSAKSIKEWLKIMSNRIECIEQSVNASFSIEGNSISKTHSEIQNFITGTDDFNNGYRATKLVFRETTKNEILVYHTKLLKCFTEVVVEINRAKKHGFIWRIRQIFN
ncbi:hypothetical protein [Bacteroides thetaiotaomicron]|jgi:hypothetical protein|uniref:hypothetical protein n=1 Tax=Bacteroides thetaiotaomicron TaxID=818 RepID=UPI00216575C9|nr:hypothetical protein [Bacteroides thetaiotaomicron]MCS2520996.1 hypothetical protein [Bacteroides thetaiotaomicron]